VFDFVGNVRDPQSVDDNDDSGPTFKNRNKSNVDSDQRPYLCMMCPKRFTAVQYLRTHIRTHVETSATGVDVQKRHRLRTGLRSRGNFNCI